MCYSFATLGELSKKHGDIPDTTDGTFVNVTVDNEIQLFGNQSVLGRSIVIHKSVLLNKPKWTCATIGTQGAHMRMHTRASGRVIHGPYPPPRLTTTASAFQPLTTLYLASPRWLGLRQTALGKAVARPPDSHLQSSVRGCVGYSRFPPSADRWRRTAQGRLPWRRTCMCRLQLVHVKSLHTQRKPRPSPRHSVRMLLRISSIQVASKPHLGHTAITNSAKFKVALARTCEVLPQQIIESQS